MPPNVERVLGQASLNERDAFRNFIEGLRVAEEAARQIALMRQDKRWIVWAHAIGNTRAIAMEIANQKFKELEHRLLHIPSGRA